MLDNTIYNLALYSANSDEKKGDGEHITHITSCKQPEFWGPKLWAFIHAGTRNYPINPTHADKKAMEKWIKTLGVMIPCEKCKVHYAKNIRKVEPKLGQICSNRSNLFSFFVDLHNILNGLKGKERMTYEEAYRMYA